MIEYTARNGDYVYHLLPNNVWVYKPFDQNMDFRAYSLDEVLLFCDHPPTIREIKTYITGRYNVLSNHTYNSTYNGSPTNGSTSK